jgi:Tol biopolymer transport system component
MPALVPGINDNDVNELAPALYQNEQLLVFSSFPNNAPADLFYAMRSSATGSFGTVAQIPTVNTTTFSEIDPVLSQDGCELYFASDRDTDRHFHLFHAQITRSRAAATPGRADR